MVIFLQANNTARELQKRVEHLEKVNIELKSRLEETVALYEQSQRDVRNKQTEIQRLTHELDKTREQKDALSRENKKLAGESLRSLQNLSFRVISYLLSYSNTLISSTHYYNSSIKFLLVFYSLKWIHNL